LSYWFFITQARFYAGGAGWNEWNKMFAIETIRNQQIIMADDADAESRANNIFGVVVDKRNTVQDHNGRWRDIGYWDSPSALEFFGENSGEMYIPGDVDAPKRWRGGVKIENTTSDGYRVRDTALVVLPMMVFYGNKVFYRVPSPKEPDYNLHDKASDGEEEIIIDIFGKL